MLLMTGGFYFWDCWFAQKFMSEYSSYVPMIFVCPIPQNEVILPQWKNKSKHLCLGIARKIFFVKCGFMAQVVFTVFALQNGLWPAKDSKTFNCGLIPTTEGPDTRYSLPKSPTKRVPITCQSNASSLGQILRQLTNTWSYFLSSFTSSRWIIFGWLQVFVYSPKIDVKKFSISFVK